MADNWTEAGTLWTNRKEGFPAMNAKTWGMSDEAFTGHYLTPSGIKLLSHLGEYVALNATALDKNLCELPTLLVADDEVRDVQSAQAFASGFYPAGCAAARAREIIVANGTNAWATHVLAPLQRS